MIAVRQDAQKPVRKFCAHKTAKNAKTHPEKPEKGETGCVLGAGEGCSRYGRVGNPEIRTKMHQIAMQHMKKGNRRKPSVFAGFLAGAEGLGLGTRFWSGCGGEQPGAGEPQCHPVPAASQKEDGAGLVLREKFWGQNSVKWLFLGGPPPRGRTRTTRRGPGRCRRLGRGSRPNPRQPYR